MDTGAYLSGTFAQRRAEGQPGLLREGSAVMGSPIDYWSLNDTELETLAVKYNIPPCDRIIKELVKRDRALRAGQSA